MSKIELHTFDFKQSYPSLESAASFLISSGLRIAVAESCTGGLLGGALTGVSGSSAYMLGGVIAYADAVKQSLLSIPAEVIEKHGAVSEECAHAMAQAVASLLGADIGMSITGISGPTGGTEAKPVGTTYIALVAPGYEQVSHFAWNGNRAVNRSCSVEAALSMITDYFESLKSKSGDKLDLQKRDS